jgi:hypothetical protein
LDRLTSSESTENGIVARFVLDLPKTRTIKVDVDVDDNGVRGVRMSSVIMRCLRDDFERIGFAPAGAFQRDSTHEASAEFLPW